MSKWRDHQTIEDVCVVCGKIFLKMKPGLLKGRGLKAGVRRHTARTCSKKCSKYKYSHYSKFTEEQLLHQTELQQKVELRKVAYLEI